MTALTPLPDRFWNKVRKTDTCWLWTAGTAKGYGRFNLTQAARAESAHRLAYESLVGPIPEGLALDHLCRVTICVNPDHLEPVPNAVNVLRGFSPPAENARKEACHRGHPFDEANTWLENARRQHRHCRTCMRLRARVKRAMIQGDFPCPQPDCDRSFASKLAVGVHVARMHKPIGGAS